MAEDSYEDERMQLLGLLGVGGKPVLSWNPGCDIRPSSQCGRYQNADNNTILLQRLLYWGLQPMLPMDGGDHSITRWQAEHAGDIPVFVAYGPMFKALQGRKWVFVAHPIKANFTLSEAGGQANVFALPNNVVGAPIVFASPRSTVTVTFSKNLVSLLHGNRHSRRYNSGLDHNHSSSSSSSSSSSMLLEPAGAARWQVKLLSPGQDAATVVATRVVDGGDLEVTLRLGSAGSCFILLNAE